MNLNFLRMLVRKVFKNETRPFRPFATFGDENLNQILFVQVRDCSVLEERINVVLTALKDNHPTKDRRENVGFLIENARGLCLRHGLSSRGSVRLASILNALESEFPNDWDVAAYVENIARPMLKEFSLDSVDL